MTMEKHEKIQASKQRNFRLLASVLVFLACVLLVWGLEQHEEEVEKAGGGLVEAAMRFYPRGDKLRKIQDLIRKEGPPVVAKVNVADVLDPNGQKVSLAALTALEKSLNAQHEQQLVQRVQELDKEVRKIKATGVHMEVDEQGLAASRRLQDATRLLLEYRYGPREPYRVKLDLKFQESNPTTATMGPTGSFVIELAPSSLQPHSIFTFLEVARKWNRKGGGGAFHRRAGHVLQVMVRGDPMPHLAFQEYSKEYPHKKGTVGYAGRPSGPAWYVSIQDNTNNHGPGSQQNENPYEADSCFGRVVEGFEDVILQRVTKMPGMGFLKPPAHVLIEKMTIQVPLAGSHENEYRDWIVPSSIVEFAKV